MLAAIELLCTDGSCCCVGLYAVWPTRALKFASVYMCIDGLASQGYEGDVSSLLFQDSM